MEGYDVQNVVRALGIQTDCMTVIIKRPSPHPVSMTLVVGIDVLLTIADVANLQEKINMPP